jgi:hypothetical protein
MEYLGPRYLGFSSGLVEEYVVGMLRNVKRRVFKYRV